MASVILVPRRLRRRRCFQPFTVAAPSSVICSAKARFSSSMAGAVLSARSPRSEMRVCERSRRFRPFNCASSGMSESVIQLARRSTATGWPAASRVTVPPACSIQAASAMAQTSGHECECSEDAGYIFPHHVFLRLGRAESRSQITWHLGNFSFNRLAPFSVNIVWYRFTNRRLGIPANTSTDSSPTSAESRWSSRSCGMPWKRARVLASTVV